MAPIKNDVWYSIDGNNWVQATDDAVWSARDTHTSLVYDNKMWVLGGYDGSNDKNDVWYSSNGINWMQATASAAWHRSSHTSLVYDNKMWVLGADGMLEMMYGIAQMESTGSKLQTLLLGQLAIIIPL